MGGKSRSSDGRQTGVVIVLLAALLVGLWLPGRIIVSTSGSLERRVFFLVPVRRNNIVRGDYLVFRKTGPEVRFLRRGSRPNNDTLIKRVGCVPGDRLTRNSQGEYLCGQRVLGRPLERDSQGRQLPQFRFAGIVPEDSYFMVGDDPRSFDSRYFGFIHGHEFLCQALPLW